MKYILVIQISAIEEVDYDYFIEIEDQIINTIDATHEVDGHDFGAGEFNIFIFTNDPFEASAQAKQALFNNNIFNMKIAYRLKSDEEYKVIYPNDFAGEFIVK